MHRTIALLLVVALLGSVTGCQTTSPTALKPTAQTPAPAATDVTKPAVTIWSDIPTWFRGTRVDTKGDRTLPAPAGTNKTVEWRYYEIPDAIPTLRNFYREQMVVKGWTQVSWSDPDVNTSVSNWIKGDKAKATDGAMIYIVTWGVGVFVAIARSTP